MLKLLKVLFKTSTSTRTFSPDPKKNRVLLKKTHGGTSQRREGRGDGQLQQPTGPVEEEESPVSKLLSVSGDSTRTVDTEDEEDVKLGSEPPVTAAPVL